MRVTRHLTMLLCSVEEASECAFAAAHGQHGIHLAANVAHSYRMSGVSRRLAAK